MVIFFSKVVFLDLGIRKHISVPFEVPITNLSNIMIKVWKFEVPVMSKKSQCLVLDFSYKWHATPEAHWKSWGVESFLLKHLFSKVWHLIPSSPLKFPNYDLPWSGSALIWNWYCTKTSSGGWVGVNFPPPPETISMGGWVSIVCSKA